MCDPPQCRPWAVILRRIAQGGKGCIQAIPGPTSVFPDLDALGKDTRRDILPERADWQAKQVSRTKVVKPVGRVGACHSLFPSGNRDRMSDMEERGSI